LTATARTLLVMSYYTRSTKSDAFGRSMEATFPASPVGERDRGVFAAADAARSCQRSMICAIEYTMRPDQRVIRGEDLPLFSPGHHRRIQLAQSHGLPQRPEPLPGAPPVLPPGRHLATEVGGGLGRGRVGRSHVVAAVDPDRGRLTTGDPAAGRSARDASLLHGLGDGRQPSLFSLSAAGGSKRVIRGQNRGWRRAAGGRSCASRY
jgi:hypothetical protein